MIIKRMTGTLLAVVLLCTMLPLFASAQSLTITADGVDRSRGSGELIVYTDAYDDTTRTNMWGAEIVVGSDNIVSEIAAGNAAIPEGGFVLSGHDDDTADDTPRMKTWLMENISIGNYVYFNSRTWEITVSDEPLEIEQSVFYTVTLPLDGVNISRGEDQLIIYTYGGMTTGTNVYGYEVVVDENGLVTTRGGNDSTIPVKGFVVSGHSAAAARLRNSVIDGMRASYDANANTVTFTYDAESLKLAMDAAINATQTALADAKAQYVYTDYEAIESALSHLKAEYDTYSVGYETGTHTDEEFADISDKNLSTLATMRNNLCDSYTVQYRGVWVRPSQMSAAEVKEYVKTLHDAGINTVCVEGWFANGVIMDVPKDSLFEKHPSFNYDVLQAYIDACHEYGMECHLWMPIMNIGSSIDSGYGRTVVAKKPEWLSLSNKGTPDNPDGFMMIDPANEEARDYLVSFYEYLVETYAIDGFEMDYIRYYATGDLDFGYTDAAFDGFEKAYGYGVTPEYDTSADYWEDWKQYRRDCVTDMVRAVSKMMTEKAPHILLSADVTPTEEDGLNGTYQQYAVWLEEGLIDMLHPMAYGDGYGEEIRKAVMWGGDNAIVATGLSSGIGVATLERQAREDNALGTYGDFYFEAQQYLTEKVGETLKQTVYRNEAIPPFLDRAASIREALRYMKGRIDDILLPLGGVTEAEATTLKDAITALSETVDDSRFSSDKLALLEQAIKAVADEQARTVLTSDLHRARRIRYVSEGRAAVWADAANDTAPANQPDIPLWIVIAGVAVAVIAATIVWIVIRRKCR